MWLEYVCPRCHDTSSVNSDWDGILLSDVVEDEKSVRTICSKCSSLIDLTINLNPILVGVVPE